MKDKIKKILEIAVHAPSGENCQPWRFRVSGSETIISNNPYSDRSLYNHDQKGSLVAIGALIENISMLAPNFGCKSEAVLFPDKNNIDTIASIKLVENFGSVKDDGLADIIINRATNRKPYKSVKLEKEKFDRLMSASKDFSGSELLFIDDDKKMATLSKMASVNEMVMLSNKSIHNFFFDHINWTPKEEEEKKTGFYIKTLELPPPAQAIFKLVKNWSLMNVLNKIKFENVIAMGNAKNYSQASAIGIISLDDNSLERFVIAGRLLQRTWINATKIGLSMQPITGVLFFKESIDSGAKNKFSQKHIELINSSTKTIKDIFKIGDSKTAIMMFRIGYGDAPSAHSSKLPPNIVFD